MEWVFSEGALIVQCWEVGKENVYVGCRARMNQAGDRGGSAMGEAPERENFGSGGWMDGRKCSACAGTRGC